MTNRQRRPWQVALLFSVGLLVVATVAFAAVELSYLVGEWNSGQDPLISWGTASELDSAGFFVWRSTEDLQLAGGVLNTSQATRVSDFITGLNGGCDTNGDIYSYPDTSADPNEDVYYYFLESLNCTSAGSVFYGDNGNKDGSGIQLVNPDGSGPPPTNTPTTVPPTATSPPAQPTATATSAPIQPTATSPPTQPTATTAPGQPTATRTPTAQPTAASGSGSGSGTGSGSGSSSGSSGSGSGSSTGSGSGSGSSGSSSGSSTGSGSSSGSSGSGTSSGSTGSSTSSGSSSGSTTTGGTTTTTTGSTSSTGTTSTTGSTGSTSSGSTTTTTSTRGTPGAITLPTLTPGGPSTSASSGDDEAGAGAGSTTSGQAGEGEAQSNDPDPIALGNTGASSVGGATAPPGDNAEMSSTLAATPTIASLLGVANAQPDGPSLVADQRSVDGFDRVIQGVTALFVLGLFALVGFIGWTYINNE